MNLCHKCQEKLCRECRQEELSDAELLAPPEYWVPDEGEATGVPGMTRMGKSTWMKGWASFLMEEAVAVLWFDKSREASVHGIQRERTPLGPLLTQATVSELEEDPGIIRQVEPGAHAPAVAIVTDSLYPTRDEVADAFVRSMQLVLPSKAEGRLVVFVDECGLFEGNRAAETMLVEMASTWGKEDVAAVFGTQSTSMVPDLCRRQWRKIAAHKQVDDNDLRALGRLMTPKFARTVERLKPHQCVLGDRLERWRWRDDAQEEACAEDAA